VAEVVRQTGRGQTSYFADAGDECGAICNYRLVYHSAKPYSTERLIKPVYGIMVAVALAGILCCAGKNRGIRPGEYADRGTGVSVPDVFYY